ncbi:alpha-glucosidase C-terminal domain-containing protein [Paenibacillus silvae]|uniref:alpha-glucosidase C-terminal domain-containing protein n=1 Tax=Paenibacillus silvae TaxID=1325358 RepID=UPI00338FEFEB
MENHFCLMPLRLIRISHDLQHPDVFAYKRTLHDKQIIVVCNFRGYKVELPLQEQMEESAKLLLANYSDHPADNELRPYEARMYLMET